ncbi:hypothetical protein Tco_0084971 [Tanacetum coccineum]
MSKSSNREILAILPDLERNAVIPGGESNAQFRISGVDWTKMIEHCRLLGATRRKRGNQAALYSRGKEQVDKWKSTNNAQSSNTRFSHRDFVYCCSKEASRAEVSSSLVPSGKAYDVTGALGEGMYRLKDPATDKELHWFDCGTDL